MDRRAQLKVRQIMVLEGRCPLHRGEMVPMSPLHEHVGGGPLDGEMVELRGCPDPRCSIAGYARGPFEPIDLLPEFKSLLEP